MGRSTIGAAVDDALTANPLATNGEIVAMTGAGYVTVWSHRKRLGIAPSPNERPPGENPKASWGPLRGQAAGPFAMSPYLAPHHERFLSNVAIVDDDDSCWEWRGRTDGRFGYGKFCAGRDMVAHRVSWEMANGREAPRDLVVRHRCDNPPCVRPSHLLIGTKRDNTRDMMDRGRNRFVVHRGDGHARSKITDAQVTELRAAFVDGSDLAVLAGRYGISDTQAGKIVRRLSHAHVDDGIPAAPRGVLRWERHRAKWGAIRDQRRSA